MSENESKQYCVGCGKEFQGGGPGRPYCNTCADTIAKTNQPYQGYEAERDREAKEKETL